MHSVRLIAGAGLVALGLAGAIACDLGIDVDSLSAGCRGDCDGGPDDAARSPIDATGNLEAGLELDTGLAVDAGLELDTDLAVDAGLELDTGVEPRDAAGEGDAAACATAGGAMALVSLGDAAVCVDRTEVTNAAYAVFLEAGAPGAAPAGCDADAGYAPSTWPPLPGREAYPVTSVTWCGAHAFCAWARKRLCGDRSGAALDPSLFGRAEFDEWFAVCSGGGASTYPYGSAYAPRDCNGNDYGVGGPLPAGSLSTCAAEGGSPLDLSGNVWEWIDACDPQGNCYARGGAYNSPMSELECTSYVASLRNVGMLTIGFRCCGL
jgi:formylglycine-generating enzyme required for sulfatase activity